MSLLLKKVKHKLLSLFKKEVVPPSYKYKRAKINTLRTKYNIKVLVETGTFLGDTVEFFKSTFEKVISIELADKLAADAQKRFEHDSNVTIIHGDSGEVLKEILADMKEPVLLWLDGHYSSEFFIGDVFVKTAKGKKETPVEEELRLIFASGINHVILIDDARLFDGKNDYPSIKKLKNAVKKYSSNYSVRIDNDIIYILPQTV